MHPARIAAMATRLRAFLQRDRSRALAVGGVAVAVMGVVACGAVGTALEAPAVGPQQASAGRAEASDKKARVAPDPKSSRCGEDMVLVNGAFCIDRWEASLVTLSPSGEERAHSPFQPIAAGEKVRAVSAPGVPPQGYVSALEAKAACAASGKRLCKPAEWRAACMGPGKKTYGYGDARVAGRCNDSARHPAIATFGRRNWTWEEMNSPVLNQLQNGLAKTGERRGCTNELGVYDMVGNLHEWVDDPAGTFNGGFYVDATMNGEGCTYSTTAHGARYHDYSTGFRCCR
jgi:hypothetical protein